MKIKTFAALIESGVTFTLRFSDAGDKNIQLDIIPVSKSNKAGINLAAKSFIGTADEIDDKLPGYLEKYLGSCQRITMISDEAESELIAAEEAAKETAKQATAAKRAGATAKAVAGKTTIKPVRDMNAGMMDDEGGDDAGDDTGDNCGDDGGDDVTADINSKSASSAAVNATTTAALDASLF